MNRSEINILNDQKHNQFKLINNKLSGSQPY